MIRTKGLNLLGKGMLLAMLGIGSAAQAAEQQSAELPVEIEISGSDDVFRLEAQVFAAKKDIYAIFSRLNEEQDYDIECKTVFRTGTRIPETQCLPNFINEQLVIQAQTDPQVRIHGVDALNPWIMEKYQKRLSELMQELTLANPELAAAVIKHKELADRLKELKGE